MKGVILVCLFYGSLPFLVLALFSLLSSGFPVFPLIVGGVMAAVAHRGKGQRGSHYQR
jgi:hypothetical protein